MDYADITAQNDFTEELVAKARANAQKPSQIQRGVCLFCESEIAPNLIFCDSYCRKEYERVERVKNRTHR